jgi:hypothetical protein
MINYQRMEKIPCRVAVNVDFLGDKKWQKEILKTIIAV